MLAPGCSRYGRCVRAVPTETLVLCKTGEEQGGASLSIVWIWEALTSELQQWGGATRKL